MENDVSPLKDFVAASKSHGASDESLVALLTRRGWPLNEVYVALGDYWASITGLPVPGHPASGESAREAFLFLLAFSTLCCWASALGSAFFSFIDHWFPDPVVRPYWVLSTERSFVTWQMATIAIAFPIYLFVTRSIVKESDAPAALAQSGVRKWLTYLALLLTAGTMIGDLIWFLHALLAGEISVRFVLKSVTVIAICGAIFAYYLPSVRMRKGRAFALPLWHRSFAVAAAAAVVTVFVLGLGIAGTPGVQRQYEADLKRVNALRRIASAIAARRRNDVAQGNRPPTSLNDLVKTGRLQASEIEDPESKQPYEYAALRGETYQLCARFSFPSENASMYAGSSTWQHGAGRTCFSLSTLNGDIY